MGVAPATTPYEPGYAGLRLTAEEYLSLPDDGRKYELIDGVVVMSPSATPRHQRIAGRIFMQLDTHVEQNSLGLVLFEVDVALDVPGVRREIVYRPELLFVRQSDVAAVTDRVRCVPAVVVEIVSPDSRSLDTRTKRRDYERAGVAEYWLIDPPREQFTFLRLDGGQYREVAHSGDRYESAAVAGFALDLAPIRKAFQELG